MDEWMDGWLIYSNQNQIFQSRRNVKKKWKTDWSLLVGPFIVSRKPSIFLEKQPVCQQPHCCTRTHWPENICSSLEADGPSDRQRSPNWLAQQAISLEFIVEAIFVPFGSYQEQLSFSGCRLAVWGHMEVCREHAAPLTWTWILSVLIK